MRFDKVNLYIWPTIKCHMYLELLHFEAQLVFSLSPDFISKHHLPHTLSSHFIQKFTHLHGQSLTINRLRRHSLSH